jgi:disulfide bond formation protein DsbB
MKKFLFDLGASRTWWAALALFGIALEAAGLYYQYALDEWPCVLCIHVRIWVLAFVLLAVVAMFFTRSRAAMRLFHGLTLVAMLGLAERSWRVLAVERGWIFGDCDLDLGMPAWFAIDEWLPAVFEVQTSCGYTPFVVFKITLAEILMAVSIMLVIASAALFAASWSDGERNLFR